MAIKEGPGTMKERPVQTRWPVVKGLTAGTTKQKGTVLNLTTEISLVSSKDKIGL